MFSQGIQESTAERYEARLNELTLWLRRHRLGTLVALGAASVRAISATLAARLHHMALELQGISRGAVLLAGMVWRFPWLRGCLSEAWRA